MNDEQILNRGGSLEDIKSYAQSNGADLTKEDIMNEQALKRFDELFAETDKSFCGVCDDKIQAGLENIKSFISKELDRARVEIIDLLENRTYECTCGAKAGCSCCSPDHSSECESELSDINFLRKKLNQLKQQLDAMK